MPGKPSDMTTILLAYDGSATAWRGLERIPALFAPPLKVVLLLALAHDGVIGGPYEPAMGLLEPSVEPFAGLPTDEPACARRQAFIAADAREALARSGIETTLREINGDPVRAIVQAATEEGADLIMMRVHGWPGAAHRLAVPVARSVVRQAPCDVLLLRD